MKKILAAFFAFGMVISTAVAVAGSAQAAQSDLWSNRTTVTGNEAG